jgi:hypothetical protein
VRVGPLTLAVYDRTALANMVDGWARALNYARRVFAEDETGDFDELERVERAQLQTELAARSRAATAR